MIIDVLAEEDRPELGGICVLLVYSAAFNLVPVLIYYFSHDMTALYIAYSLTFCCFIKIVISKCKVYSTNKRLQAIQTLANVVVDDQTRPSPNSPSSVQSESEDVNEGVDSTATRFNMCITINDDQQEHLVHGYIREHTEIIPERISSVCMKYYYSWKL